MRGKNQFTTKTVNLLAYAFDGSDPSPTTTFSKRVKGRFFPYFSMDYSVMAISRDVCFPQFLTAHVFSKTMLRK